MALTHQTEAGLGGSGPVAQFTGSDPSTRSSVPPFAKMSSHVTHALFHLLPFTFRLWT